MWEEYQYWYQSVSEDKSEFICCCCAFKWPIRDPLVLVSCILLINQLDWTFGLFQVDFKTFSLNRVSFTRIDIGVELDMLGCVYEWEYWATTFNRRWISQAIVVSGGLSLYDDNEQLSDGVLFEIWAAFRNIKLNIEGWGGIVPFKFDYHKTPFVGGGFRI